MGEFEMQLAPSLPCRGYPFIQIQAAVSDTRPTAKREVDARESGELTNPNSSFPPIDRCPPYRYPNLSDMSTQLQDRLSRAVEDSSSVFNLDA